MKHNIRTILAESNTETTLNPNFSSNVMVEIRLIHARKQMYKFILNTAKVLISLVLVFAFLGLNISNFMSTYSSMMASMIVSQPSMLLTSTGLKAAIEIFPILSFGLLTLSVIFSFKFIKEFNSQQIIPLNSPLYELI